MTNYMLAWSEDSQSYEARDQAYVAYWSLCWCHANISNLKQSTFKEDAAQYNRSMGEETGWKPEKKAVEEEMRGDFKYNSPTEAPSVNAECVKTTW